MANTVVIMLQNVDPEMLGFLPHFLNPDDPRSATEQLDANYQHGGGWHPLKGWKFDRETHAIQYCDDEVRCDEPYLPVAMSVLHGDVVYFYPDAWVAVLKASGAVEVARMD
jgi:hypothetical protein